MGITRPRALLARLLLTCLAAASLTAGLTAAVPGSARAADRDCGDFASQRAAQIFFLNHGGPRSDPHGLDSDGDGVACESNPGPYYYGTTPPAAPTSPPPPPAPTVVTTRVAVSLSRAAAIAGEPVVVRASVTPRLVRSVTFQRWNGGRWTRLAARTTTRAGVATLRTATPRAATRYRALVAAKTAGGKRYTAATSAARALRVQRQSLALTLSQYRVAEHGTATATVRSLPVRAGRTVMLQVRDGGQWRTVVRKRLTRTGRLAFTVRAGSAGGTVYRAWAVALGGAAGVASATRTLTAEDRTAPAAPTGLVAVPGDGSVALSWDAPDDDAASYRVFRRVAGTTGWTQAGSTTSWSAVVPALTNGTGYEFSVIAVDDASNASPRSAVVAATPVGPGNP